MMPDGTAVGFAESGDLVVSHESAIKAVVNAASRAAGFCRHDAAELHIVEHGNNEAAAPAP